MTDKPFKVYVPVELLIILTVYTIDAIDTGKPLILLIILNH